MCVGPSGLQLCGTAIEWTAWATVALAAVGAISIIVNSYLASSTHKSAKSAKEQVGLERSQLALFQRQLELAEKQFNAAGGSYFARFFSPDLVAPSERRNRCGSPR